MALLLKSLNPAISHYRDRRFNGDQEAFEQCLTESTTIYVGNLSFFTTEDQLYEARPMPQPDDERAPRPAPRAGAHHGRACARRCSARRATSSA